MSVRECPTLKAKFISAITISKKNAHIYNDLMTLTFIAPESPRLGLHTISICALSLHSLLEWMDRGNKDFWMPPRTNVCGFGQFGKRFICLNLRTLSIAGENKNHERKF